jgi:EAL domain-containing protein (putative c-di-GMP-specific phosphodiesterase class I)/CheY-like chemotaxis protein
MTSTQYNALLDQLVPEYNLLVVDDEEDNLKAIKRSFRRTRYQVFTANSAKEALNILEQQDVQVVLSDFRMPDVDGGALVKSIKQCYPNIVSMILTAYADFDSAVSVMNTGAAYKFLTKPWSNQQLIDEVDEAFKEYEKRLIKISAEKLSEKYINPGRVQFDKTIKTLLEKQAEFALISIIISDVSLNDRYWTKTEQGLTLDYATKIINACSLKNYEIFKVEVDQLLVISTNEEKIYGLHEELISLDQSLSSSVENTINMPKLHCNFAYALAPFEGMDISQLLHSMRNISEQDYINQKLTGNKAHIIKLDTEFIAQKKRKKQIQNSIQQAINTNQFRLYFQPKVRVDNGLVETAEVLMRWQHDTLGWISPIEFIALSELDGQIQAIGSWLIENSISQLIDLKARFKSDLNLAINVSPRQLQSDQIVDQLAYLLKKTGLPASSVELEITEGCTIEDLEKTASVLWKLKGLGVKIAIDDFGSGYSSFSYLSKLPIDVLKLDKILIDDLGINQDVSEMLQSIIQLCRKMNIKVVAEGVEEQKQVAMLKEYNCDYIQGYVYSKPVTKTEFENILMLQPFKFN